VNLEAVMEEIAENLRTITSVAGRTFGFPPSSITPPAAIVGYPEVKFDQTYGRGFDRWTVPVWVVVGKVDDRNARTLLSPYLSGTGNASVKAALDDGTYVECDSVTVVSATVTQMEIAADPYLAAEFSVDVVGSGE